jgi:hypothetical protein
MGGRLNRIKPYPTRIDIDMHRFSRVVLYQLFTKERNGFPRNFMAAGLSGAVRGGVRRRFNHRGFRGVWLGV